jgi:predicted Zn-dependent protease
MQADALDRMQKYPEALASIEKAIQLQPEDALLHINRANVLVVCQFCFEE